MEDLDYIGFSNEAKLTANYWSQYPDSTGVTQSLSDKKINLQTSQLQ